MSTSPTTSAYGSEPAWDVALLFPPQGQWSVEEYLSLTDDINRFVEFTAGRIEVLPTPTVIHQRILVFLFMRLKEFVDAHDLGEVLPSVLRVRLAEDKFREPDIVFLGRGKDSGLGRYWDKADLVVEIVSDDRKSRERDHIKKRKDYAEAGISEYWIVDPQQQQISVLTLQGRAYELIGEFTPGQAATSKLLPGFAVDVKATFKAAEQ
ncbi:MAG TPA: Uma2 family endonuclease [Lacipirellula sp.]